jgi:glycerol-3-phosphate acyltransferase PlsY
MTFAILNAVLWTVIGYLAGSLMSSAWLVRIFLKQDIEQAGGGRDGGNTHGACLPVYNQETKSRR